MESWRVVKNYPSYEISDKGRVRSLVTGKFRKIASHRQGYKNIRLYFNGTAKTLFIHRLVMGAFIGTSDLMVNHKNMDKADNRLCNLEYVTRSENGLHSFANDPKRRENLIRVQALRSPIKNKDIKTIFRLYAKGITQVNIALKFNVTQAAVSSILRGKSRKLFG